jgi:gamma-glutamyl-gamma-aminobutyrate hydrolase PuuD
MKRIGLTMRVVTAEGYTEERDALAWDWHRFLASAFPDACWLSIPNLGNRVDDYIREWRIDGLILTGGNDLGSAPLRDMTERALLGYALENSIPTFGVCRGLQVIQHHFGGAIRPCPGGSPCFHPSLGSFPPVWLGSHRARRQFLSCSWGARRRGC